MLNVCQCMSVYLLTLLREFWTRCAPYVVHVDAVNHVSSCLLFVKIWSRLVTKCVMTKQSKIEKIPLSCLGFLNIFSRYFWDSWWCAFSYRLQYTPGKYEISRRENRCILKIVNAAKDDEAEYSCEVEGDKTQCKVTTEGPCDGCYNGQKYLF